MSKNNKIVLHVDHLVEMSICLENFVAKQLEEAVSTAVLKALEAATMPLNENLHRETGNSAKPSKVGRRPLPDQNDISQKYDRGVFGTLLTGLSSAVKSGNTQDQLSLLAKLDALQRMLHHRTGTRVLSRSQFLAVVQHFLELAGLGLGTGVRRSYLHSSRCNSHAKV